MSDQTTLENTINAIFSQVLEFGLPLCEAQVGQMIDQYGRDRVLASLSPRQAKALGLLTSGTYGQPGTISSHSAALRTSLESRLRARTALAGSTLFKLTWKQQATPSGRLFSLLRASVRRTDDTGFSSWPTPCSQDGPNGGPAQGEDLLS